MKKLFPQSRLLIALYIILVPLTVTAAPFGPDDVFLSNGDSKIYHYRAGNLVEVLNTGAGTGYSVRGMCFSTNGDYLYATSALGTSSGRVSRFDNQGGLLDEIWGPAYPMFLYPVSCALDASGNVYVGVAAAPGATESPSIRKIGPDGSLLAYFRPETNEIGYPNIDLASDQCTVIYTSGGQIKRFDVCNNSQLPDLADLSDLPPGNRTCSAVRIRKNGEVMVVCEAQGGTPAYRSDILRLGSNGQIIRGYEAPHYQIDRCGSPTQPPCAPFFAVNFAPDGTTFWAATSQYGTLPGRVIKIDIESGQLVSFFDVTSFMGVAVYREPTAATTECSDGIDNDNDGAIDYPDDGRCTGPTYASESLWCRTILGRTLCLGTAIWIGLLSIAAVLAALGARWFYVSRPKPKRQPY